MPQALLRGLILCALAPLYALAASPALELSGGDTSLRDNIRAYLNLPGLSCQLSSWRKSAYLNDVNEKVRDAARALGYYQLQVQAEITRKDECWRLKLDLTPGERVTYASVITELKGEGTDNAALLRVLAANPMIEGAYFHHGQYESYKTALLNEASAQGFFDAKFVQSQVVVSQQDNTARVTLTMDTGEQYRIGDIAISHDILRRSLIDRYVRLQPGQAYRSEDLVALKSELQASRYFESVTVEPQLNRLAGGRVPVKIELQGGPKHHYLVGAGYSSDSGARIRFGYENRYLNQSGHNLNFNINASEILTTYQVSYSIPMQRPGYQVLRIYTGFSQEDINKSTSNRLASGVNYSSWESRQWLNNYGLSVEEEEFYFGDEASTTSKLIIPMFSTSYSAAGKDVKYPRRGWSAFVRVKGASQSMGSSTDFVQAFARLKLIFPVAEGRLLMRFEGGITEVDDFARLPISQRFFAGGDASVRGYDFKTLGPVNDEGIVLGGSRLLSGSVEYDQKVYGDLVLAAFYDEGSAFNEGYLEPYRGAGFGLRWLSPVGPVRADIARALDGDQGWRLHLSVGPDL